MAERRGGSCRRRLPARLLALALALGAAGPASAAASAEERDIRRDLEARTPEMTALLAAWTGFNTGSFHLRGLEQFAAYLQDPLAEMGFDASVVSGARIELPDRAGVHTGPLIIARRRAARAGAPRFLVVGHYDTVFEPDSGFVAWRPGCRGEAIACGPGVVDMKGGLVVMIYALRALHRRGELDRAHWTILLNADEEIGSPGSRAWIEEEARRADYGFVFEPAQSDGAMVSSRRGIGQFHLRVQGVAAHAGVAHAEGRSAIRTLADQVLRIEALTDERRGVTLNVGTIQGGEKRNVVPAHASAWVDLRYDEQSEGERVKSEIARIAGEPLVEGTRVEVWSSLHRPPKPATEGSRSLLAAHAAVAGDLGVALPPAAHSGGGTDGSVMQAVGLATLDSLGAVGGGAHTPEEFVRTDVLGERSALAAILWRRLALRTPARAVD
jgi:glutamate carboxypeptidase